MTAVTITIKLNEQYDARPKITMLLPKPPKAIVLEVRDNEFDVKVLTNPCRLLALKYKINFKSYTLQVPIQFCPTCKGHIAEWVTITPLALGHDHKAHPTIPQAICPLCQSVFVSNSIWARFKAQQKNLIVTPNRIIS